MVGVQTGQVTDRPYEPRARIERPGPEERARAFAHDAPVLDPVGLLELSRSDLLAHALQRISTGTRPGLEHRVLVRTVLGERLQHVPVLDDLTVLETEEVCGDGATVVGHELQQAVRNHDVAVSEDAADVDARLGERLHEPDECLLAIGSLWVVLDVLRADILLDSLLRLLAVERELVELDQGDPRRAMDQL